MMCNFSTDHQYSDYLLHLLIQIKNRKKYYSRRVGAILWVHWLPSFKLNQTTFIE